ncbi:MAG: hypothetical protein LUQ62_05190 [Methanomicrobiales archaeon]|nr:hypothetical protein [Methanomicrobiales archaeon]
MRQKRIVIAAGCRCELCGEEYLAADLEIHTLGTERARTGGSPADLERELLVLCSCCHQDLHRNCVSDDEQRALLTYRTPEMTEAIREILSTKLKPYVPPEVDLEETFADATHLRTHYRGM